MRRALAILAVAVVSSLAAADAPLPVVGTWRGLSLCTVPPNPCHDEDVVYHIVAGQQPNAVVVKANKIVDGKEANMGALECAWSAAKKTLSCPFPKGTFIYQLEGRTMTGKLVLPDGTLFRNVLVKKLD